MNTTRQDKQRHLLVENESKAEYNAYQNSDSAMSGSLQIPDSLSTSDLSIAVISPDVDRRDAATSALRECQSGSIQEFISYPSPINDVPQVLEHKFDVVLVELDSDPTYAINLIEKICAHGLATVMAYSMKIEPDLMLRCMRAGSREFLTLPLAPGDMAEALARASALRTAIHPPKIVDCKMHVFVGAKGGSGATTLACNFAVSLAQESGQKTLLIDLNLPLGDAAINLGIKAQYSIANAFQNSSRLDLNFLSTLLVQHSSGLYVLAAPSELAPTNVSTDAISKLLEVARQGFDHVVIDAGARLDVQVKRLFDESATIYLVTQVGIAELRNSNRLVSQIATMGHPKLEIVINRYESGSMGIDDEHITKALSQPAQWKIPNNYAAVRLMQNTATSLMQGDSQISKVIREMTRSVCSKPAPPEKKKKFSFFR
jgi:pilus assembly protein CpaE